MLRVWCVLFLAFLPLAAAAPTVVVPSQVLGGDVAFRVESLGDAQNVTITLGTGTTAAATTIEVSSASFAFHVFSNVPAGMQPWTVEASNATASETVSGAVYVSDPFADLASLKQQVASLNTSIQALDTAGIATDVTQLKSEIQALSTAVDGIDISALLEQESPKEAPQGASTSPLTTAGAMTSALLAVGILVLVGVMQWQSNRRHQEQMVLILAMAARMNVGPESPEFQTALAAMD